MGRNVSGSYAETHVLEECFWRREVDGGKKRTRSAACVCIPRIGDIVARVYTTCARVCT